MKRHSLWARRLNPETYSRGTRMMYRSFRRVSTKDKLDFQVMKILPAIKAGARGFRRSFGRDRR
jgi:hypothetical protein